MGIYELQVVTNDTLTSSQVFPNSNVLKDVEYLQKKNNTQSSLTSFLVLST